MGTLVYQMVLHCKCNWMNGFKDGIETTEDDKHTGQPVTSTNDRKVAEFKHSWR